ncbi:hypothetical protein JMJ58_02505 [Haloterrigena salifodinae]|uniref:Uncharacterized protein n=1 Tax=Haloterrigena salifodinae TaxID=2675099 RepID=A0A8T8E1T4_9EURY|nr:hypothetical protein [Haloterrigena salifodinae]QRV15794.1 hypothetical protein JMJ58_02505 [Haloterrigena salifodinae]
MRYSIDAIKKGVKNPRVAAREMNRLYFNFTTRKRNAIDIFDRDWDNLIILDACRYDKFEEKSEEIPGSLSKAISQGSTTEEFLRGNFSDIDLTDTICVTTNAWYQKLQEELNLNFFRLEYREYNSPEPLANDALDLIKEHPNKRIIIHFLPPHTPYVGETADQHLPDYDNQHGILSHFHQNNIAPETIKRAYMENLDRVLPEVANLLDNISGKTVVTADHGELLGDRTFPIPISDWGHYKNLHIKPLVCVPWLESSRGDRRDIIREKPLQSEQDDVDESVDDRLRELGYKV